MPLPIANGQQWITASLGSPPLSLELPIPEVIRYISDMGDYAECGIGSHYRVDLLDIATSSVANIKTNNTLTTEWKLYTTVRPGIIDRIVYGFREGLEFEISGINFHFGFTSSSLTKYGVIVNSPSGSSHLSLEPFTSSVVNELVGDIWTANYGKVKMVDNDGVNTFLSARVDTSSLDLLLEMRSGKINTSHIGSRKAYFNNWIHGSGLKNYDWDGGIVVKDSSSLELYGENKKFTIPSGSLIVEKHIQLFNNPKIYGNISSKKGIYLSDGMLISNQLVLSGAYAQLSLNESGSQFLINQNPVSVIRIRDGVHDTSSIGFDGEWYLYTDSGSHIYIRAENEWYTMISSSNFYSSFDGGYY